MERLSGLRLLEEREGEGREAQRGDYVIYNSRIFLNKGEEVRIQEEQIRSLPKDVFRVVDDTVLLDHTTRLGSRQTIAGVEHALLGMKVGGYRRVRISPHLAYRDKGVPGFIPADAVLVVEVWLRAIVGEGKVTLP
ncbi:FKBP-type peptidyl-prolyl cis-trans isomerase [Nitrospira sp. BLG_1]|uniref:FKBP-type peptidyl-prolyl cis-trans isomerase n=1 Tax=Nitrospira sp. BLG_1 TaxID=3395883 RepID=UPI0039BC3C0F